jgi:hypothetical protein
MLKALFFASHSIMSVFSNALEILGGCIKRIKQSNSFLHRPSLDTGFIQSACNYGSGYSEAIRNALFRLAPDIAFDDIARIKVYPYNGHVYDLQIGDDTIYMSNGVLVKNCLCNISQVYEDEAPANGPSDYNPKRAQKYLAGLSEHERRDLMGIKGAEKFADNPKTWQKNLRNWNGQEKKIATIPESVLYGGK